MQVVFKTEVHLSFDFVRHDACQSVVQFHTYLLNQPNEDAQIEKSFRASASYDHFLDLVVVIKCLHGLPLLYLSAKDQQIDDLAYFTVLLKVDDEVSRADI